MGINELRIKTGMSQSEFAKYFGIPVKTIRNWEQGARECSEYILELIEYKIMKENLISERYNETHPG